MLVGNLVAILSSGIICTVISLIKPDDYDWSSSREIKMIEEDTTGMVPGQPSTAVCILCWAFVSIGPCRRP